MDTVFEGAKKTTVDDLRQVDDKIVEGKEWAIQLKEKLNLCVEKSFLNWCEVVINLTNQEDVLKTWSKSYYDHFEQRCCELVTDMENLQAGVITNIETLLRTLEQLCRQLGEEMPPFGQHTRSLYEEKLELKKAVKAYEERVESRKAEITKLLNKEQKICKCLGRHTKSLEMSPLPSQTKVLDFHKYLEELETEKFTREEKFISIKADLIQIQAELNIVPTLDWERKVLSADDPDIFITDENMQTLDALLRRLKDQLENVKEEVATIRQHLEHVWNVVEIDLLEREQFRKRVTGHSLDTLKALKVEKARCEELKKANIEVFILKYRTELQELWKKCHCNQKQKDEFTFFDVYCYDEDLLELFELEIGKWKRYYAENEKLFKLLEDYNQAWRRISEMEDQARDPHRYKNRGGQLLKEEKERNKLTKKLPLIEAELLNEATAYLQRKGEEFLSDDRTVQQHIASRHAEIELDRKNKLSARKQERENQLTPGKTLFASHSTQHLKTPLGCRSNLFATPCTSGMKRKLLHTPASAINTKKSKTNLSPKKSATGPRVPRVLADRHRRISLERKKILEKKRSLQKKNKSLSKETTVAEYSDFEDDLSRKADCRSTQYMAPAIDSPLRPKVKPPRLVLTVDTPKTKQ